MLLEAFPLGGGGRRACEPDGEGLYCKNIQPPSHSLRESSPRGGALKKLSVRGLIRLAMLGTFPQGEGFKQLPVENSFLPKARKRAGGPPPSGREISDHFPLESIFTSTLGGGGAPASGRDGRSFKRAVVERLPKGEACQRTNRYRQAKPTESFGSRRRGSERQQKTWRGEGSGKEHSLRHAAILFQSVRSFAVIIPRRAGYSAGANAEGSAKYEAATVFFVAGSQP